MDLFIVGWVGLGQLIVAARQTVQCTSILVFVIKSFKMPNFTNVDLTDTVLAYGLVRRVATWSKRNNCTGQRLRETGSWQRVVEPKGNL
jgi:hypothetical protein